MDKSEILKVFIDQLNDFLEDVYKVFTGDKKLLFAKDSIYAFSLVRPKKLIELWKLYVQDPYREQIDNKDFTFFIDKDYTDDFAYLEYKESVMDKLNELRESIRNMEENNKQKSMAYVENLVKLCDIYYEN